MTAAEVIAALPIDADGTVSLDRLVRVAQAFGLGSGEVRVQRSDLVLPGFVLLLRDPRSGAAAPEPVPSLAAVPPDATADEVMAVLARGPLSVRELAVHFRKETVQSVLYHLANAGRVERANGLVAARDWGYKGSAAGNAMVYRPRVVSPPRDDEPGPDAPGCDDPPEELDGPDVEPELTVQPDEDTADAPEQPVPARVRAVGPVLGCTDCEYACHGAATINTHAHDVHHRPATREERTPLSAEEAAERTVTP